MFHHIVNMYIEIYANQSDTTDLKKRQSTQLFVAENAECNLCWSVRGFEIIVNFLIIIQSYTEHTYKSIKIKFMATI